MTVIAVELMTSRTTAIPTTTKGGNSKHEKTYVVTGTDDEQEAIEAVYAEAPDHFGGSGTAPYFPYMPLLAIDMTPISIVEGEPDQCRWNAVASYATVPGGGTGDEEVFQFNTGGSTKHITQSIDTRLTAKVIGDPDDIPDENKVINVMRERGGPSRIEGTDIVWPTFSFSETHYFDDSEVTSTFKNKLCELTGTVNNSAFKGFDSYEVLFIGASGMRRGTGDWEITFNFQAQKTQSLVEVGDIILSTVRGWEYVWVQYDDDVSNNRGVKKPKFAYVEQVYRYTDFSQLGLDP